MRAGGTCSPSAPNSGGSEARSTSGRDSFTSSMRGGEIGAVGGGASSRRCGRVEGGCAPSPFSVSPAGCRRNHRASMASRASAGLGALRAAGLVSLALGASRSEKSSSWAAPLAGPFRAPASRAERRPSSSPVLPGEAAVSGCGFTSFEAARPSPDRLLRIEARISSRLLAPAASGLLIPHLTRMPIRHPGHHRTRPETTWRTHRRPQFSIAEARAPHQRRAPQQHRGSYIEKRQKGLISPARSPEAGLPQSTRGGRRSR